MCVIWKKTFFSTLILGSVFSDYVVFYGDGNLGSQHGQLKTAAYFNCCKHHVCLCNTRTKMYAGRIACCPLVNHVEYA